MNLYTKCNYLYTFLYVKGRKYNEHENELLKLFNFKIGYPYPLYNFYIILEKLNTLYIVGHYRTVRKRHKIPT